MYCAIIGDLVGSRKLDAVERKHVQTKLSMLLDEINAKWQHQIASKFLITLGDEFQGLLDSPERVPEIAEFLIWNLSPQIVRIGVGIGAIYTDINPKQAIGADGPAYHLAREAVQTLKNDWVSGNAGFPVRFRTDKPDEALLNAVCAAIDRLMVDWTAKQREAVWQTALCNDHQQEAARVLGINPSTVTRHLKSAGYAYYRQWLRQLTAYLAQEYKEAACN